MVKNKLVVTQMFFCDDGDCDEAIRLQMSDTLSSHGWYEGLDRWILCPIHNPDNQDDVMPTEYLTFSQEKKSLKEFASDLGLDPTETPGKRVIKRK